jgi:hypothetical protein
VLLWRPLSLIRGVHLRVTFTRLVVYLYKFLLSPISSLYSSTHGCLDFIVSSIIPTLSDTISSGYHDSAQFAKKIRSVHMYMSGLKDETDVSSRHATDSATSTAQEGSRYFSTSPAVEHMYHD